MALPKYPAGSGGENLGRPSTANSSLLRRDGRIPSARVRALHTNPASASNVVHARRPSSSAPTAALRRAMDAGVNRNERCRSGDSESSSSSPSSASSSVICVNSWCGKSTCGGSRARRTARSRAGGSDSGRPRAVSPHELTNCMAPTPSNMQWLMASPSTKPPHLNLVTLHVHGSIDRPLLLTLSIDPEDEQQIVPGLQAAASRVCSWRRGRCTRACRGRRGRGR
ncbi:hypothetical protein SORBI_3001G107001 [Sorghum bicolor]|uniref:Uncharacterized protein n=1 Tax=Sorghum bicolor TaxID=4558 RepID=A0A1Z5S559_SORBI|nr:hypothetical protein SORBI_3001G107001 [Sorghum bicolor]